MYAQSIEEMILPPFFPLFPPPLFKFEKSVTRALACFPLEQVFLPTVIPLFLNLLYQDLLGSGPFDQALL